jgi:hypothetical protein
MALGQQTARDAGRALVGRMGFGLFSPLRRIRHRPVQGEPVPRERAPRILRLDARLSERGEHSCFHPYLQPIPRWCVCTPRGLIESLPVASRSQLGDNGIRAVVRSRFLLSALFIPPLFSASLALRRGS